MSTAIQDNFVVDVSIDGTPIPKALPNAIGTVEVIENSELGPPQALVHLLDPKNVLINELNLTDDNKVSITIARNASDGARPLNFRLFRKKSGVTAEGYGHQLYCLLDAPGLTKGIDRKSWKLPSSDVLRNVLTQAGLQIDGNGWESTGDQQVWINPGISRMAFVNQLIAHSYKADTALMRLGIRAEGFCRFKDVFAAVSSGPAKVIAYGSPKYIRNADYVTKQIKMGTTGGFLSSYVGYGYDVWDSRVDGKVMKSDAISLQMSGAFAPMNQEAYDAVSAVRQDYVPNSGGNEHDKYWQAYHANLRKKALFTQTVAVIIERTTQINVLDAVELRLSPMDMGVEGRKDAIDQSAGGRYYVTAKKRIVRGTKYAELLLLLRMSVNLQGSTRLVVADTGRGSPTPTPQDQGKAGKSEWTYEKESRYSDPKDGVADIIDEEVMPTPTDSTEWDNPQCWTDGYGAKNGPYEVALTGKVGVVKKRPTDTDPEPRN